MTEPMPIPSRVGESSTKPQIQYCPDCLQDNENSPVERFQFEEKIYWVHCTKQGCGYLEEFPGTLPVSKEDLLAYGLPAQLSQHMDIYPKDIPKIVNFCMSEYLKHKYSKCQLKKQDLKEFKDEVNRLAVFHEIEADHVQNATKQYGIYEDINKLAKKMVAGLSSLYKEQIKNAFLKIEGYNFPEQFVEDVGSNNFPLHKIIAEYEIGMKAEDVEKANELTKVIYGVK